MKALATSGEVAVLSTPASTLLVLKRRRQDAANFRLVSSRSALLNVIATAASPRATRRTI